MGRTDRVNVEIHIEDLEMTTCIWAPATLTTGELRQALVGQLKLDNAYRELALESDGARVALDGSEVLGDLLARSSGMRLFLTKG